VEAGRLSIFASLIAPDGSVRVDRELEAPADEAAKAGIELAKMLLAAGGDAVMKMVRD